MSDDQIEQGELTERFRAFAESVDPEPAKGLPVGLIVGGAVILLGLLIVVWLLATA